MKKKKSPKKQKLKMNLMSLDSLKGLDASSRIEGILTLVRQGRMVILDGRLDSDEELLLVQATMGNVEENFPGIEVCTIEREPTKYQELYQKLMTTLTKKSFTQSGLTFIGPSKVVKQIKKLKEESAFEVLAEI